MERDDLIGKIIEIAGDYRKGEIVEFDYDHVSKWINQFSTSEQGKNIILHEVGHMLEKNYISREDAKSNLSKMFGAMKKDSAGGCDICDVNFLRTQPPGKSQSEILLIADELLQEVRGIKTHDCGGSKVYLYLDDAVYSGSKWRYDIEKSEQLMEAPNGITIVSFHFDLYSGGYGYSKGIIDKMLIKKGAVIKPFRIRSYNNERFGGKELDILWPTFVNGNKDINTYVASANASALAKNWSLRRMFRETEAVSGNVFTSPTNQHLVEQAFLSVGSKLFCAAAKPAPSMRPMGFEVIGTIGFGTPIVTWRNIANNCPLALWYGDPAYDASHPLGMWYPLFPRKV